VHRLYALIGLVIIIGIAWVLSNNKKNINFKTFAWGLGLQFAFAILVLKGAQIETLMEPMIPGTQAPFVWLLIAQFVALYAVSRFATLPEQASAWLWRILGAETLLLMLRFNLLGDFFTKARDVVTHIIEFSGQGASFVFGKLGGDNEAIGFVFAFRVLPTIIFVASIFAIMYYLGVMQVIVRVVARFMARLMGTSGAESTSVAASIFMGQTEAPLTIRPFLSGMTMSELMTIMTAGMAHVSGGIMAAYVLVANVDIQHLLAAVIMTAPGSIFMSKIIVPEVDTPETGMDVKVDIPIHDVNIIDAAARGASEGGHLALNVAYMLVAFVALVALVNGMLGWVHDSLAGVLGYTTAWHLTWFPSSLQDVFGFVLKPLAFVMGVPWKDAGAIGSLMGERMVINEFVAFIDLGKIKDTLDPRSFTIATYALCGFANFSSVAIQIGGIGALAEDRRHDLARLGIRAMIAGTLANYLTACIAGMLLD